MAWGATPAFYRAAPRARDARQDYDAGHMADEGAQMLVARGDYGETRGAFRWQVPERYNIAVDACDKWADGSGRLALIQEESPATVQRDTFDDLKRWYGNFCNGTLRTSPYCFACMSGAVATRSSVRATSARNLLPSPPSRDSYHACARAISLSAPRRRRS